MAPIGVWNQSSLHENALVRSVAALPFLAFIAWSFLCLRNLELNIYLDAIILSGRLKFGRISIPILNKFLDIKALDDLLRPKTVAFASSTFGVDLVGWFQNFSFLVDYSLLYSLWLFESARKANEKTLAAYPLLFGMLAQVFGIGILAPLYFLLHYVNTPLNRLTTSNQRINPEFSRAIFLTLIVFCYLPTFLMFLAPLPSTRHLWTWVWQMFPLCVSSAQWVRTRTTKIEHPQIHKEGNNSNDEDHIIIRATIAAFAAMSAGVWIFMLLNSPYSLSTIFLRLQNPENSFVLATRAYFQISHLATLGSALMWLVYLFADLKNADLVKQSWIFLLATGGVLTLCSGPGVTLAVGWYWRERILRRESKGEYAERREDENETGRYKKIALQSLDELYFGGMRGQFKVL